MQKRKGRKPGKKAVVRAECLDRLKGGATPTELLREFSPGPVYDAVREFLTFSAGEVEEIRRSRERELQELARVQKEGKAAGESMAARRAEADSLSVRLRGLDQDIKGREQRVAELRQVESRLDSKLRDYSGRGITDKMFTRLDRFSFGGEDELLSRLDTAERYLGFVSETEKVENQLLESKKRLKALDQEKTNLDAEIGRLRGVRDEELSKNYVQRDSIRILSTFYDDKYTSDDIEGIRIGLNTLGIAGDPKTSVRRLLDFLGGVIELVKLQGEIDEKREELRILNKSIDWVKGQLIGFRDTALVTLTETEATSKARIEEVYTDAVGRVKSVGEAAEKQIHSISSSQLVAIDASGKAGISNLINIHDLAKQKIEETVDTVRNEVKTTIREEFAPYHKAFELIPMMQPFVEYGYLLMRVPMDRTLANKVPKIFVANMAISIDLYVREMLPEAETTIPEDIAVVSPLLKIQMKCKLSAVSMWLRQELAYITRFS